MNKPSLTLKAPLYLIAVVAVAAVVFVVSIFIFSLLIPIALVVFVIVVIGEWQHVFNRYSWLRYLCWAWMILIFPTFGIMPLLMASQLLFYLPIGKTLAIFTGFTYTYIYDLFI
jgi:hypothetical protein